MLDYSMQSEWSMGMLAYEMSSLLSPYPRWPRRMLGDGTMAGFHVEEQGLPLRLPASGAPAAAAPGLADLLRALVLPDPG